MNQDYKHPFHNPNHATRVSETFFFQKFVDISNVDKIVSPKYEMLVTYFLTKITLNPCDWVCYGKSKYKFVFLTINFVTNQNRKK